MTRKIYGESVKGASHKRSGMPCQDSFRTEEYSDDLAIIAVADGHGSEKSPLSKNGSQMAVNAFCRIMDNYRSNYADSIDDLITYLNRDGAIHFAKEVCEEWQRRVKESFYKKKEFTAPTSEDGATEWTKVYQMYGTTLLGMLVSKTFVFAFQIGDGDIMMVDNDSISPVVESEKILGVETHSLSKTDAWKHAVTSVRKRDADQGMPYMFMMSTDGFANSYTSDDEYKKTCRDYFDMVKEHGFETVCGNLKKWLSETSELGCGDDITVVMSYFSEGE